MAALEIRKATVAGSFYAGEARSLNIQIEKCFFHKLGPGKLPPVNLKEEGRKIIGLVSPHAGYVYSGPVAAQGFYRVALDGRPDIVIILGPNHHGLGAPVSIMTSGKWETPLGQLEIDSDLAEKILDSSRIIREDPQAHQYEHSIEVQLPFLQYIFDQNFKFVPICMSRQDIKTDLEIARSICTATAVESKNILIIASSDFTHYEPQEYAEDADRQAIEEAILELDAERLYEVIYEQNLTMCGPGPIAVMLIAAKTLGAKKAELLKYATSGDITGDYDQVVGYASLIVRKG